MGVAHCPICVALAFVSACIGISRFSMVIFLHEESKKNKKLF